MRKQRGSCKKRKIGDDDDDEVWLRIEDIKFKVEAMDVDINGESDIDMDDSGSESDEGN